MDILMSKEPSYVRCVKPNDYKRPGKTVNNFCEGAIIFCVANKYKVGSLVLRILFTLCFVGRIDSCYTDTLLSTTINCNENVFIIQCTFVIIENIFNFLYRINFFSFNNNNKCMLNTFKLSKSHFDCCMKNLHRSVWRQNSASPSEVLRADGELESQTSRICLQKAIWNISQQVHAYFTTLFHILLMNSVLLVS